MQQIRIFGAGLAGLLAGCAFRNALIFERNQREHIEHQALLRFRTPAVGNFVGIEFKPVRVHKGIWSKGALVAPDIRLANLYSLKVIGNLSDRSIWNVDSVERYIAPEDLIARLIDQCEDRIHWGRPVNDDDITLRRADQGIKISTIPLGAMAQMCDEHHALNFEHAPINVQRFRIDGANVYQTIYFPEHDTPVYRASITGNLLIIESVGALKTGLSYPIGAMTDDVLAAFGLRRSMVEAIGGSTQRFGKIAAVESAPRKELIWRLTEHHRVFSLGRYGTWRNILLDDVLDDIAVVKRLITASGYDTKRASLG